MSEFSELYDAIIAGDAKTAVAVTEKAISGDCDPQELVNKHMIPAMDEVGRRFEQNEYFVPELLISARAMKGALALIRPLLAARGTEQLGRIVSGTVRSICRAASTMPLATSSQRVIPPKMLNRMEWTP